MLKRHPFIWLDETRWGRTFIALLALTLSLTWALTRLGQPLKTYAAPGGILSFEFAGDLATAITILESWNPSTRVFAGLNLGLDYLYIFAYPCCIGLGCLLVARRFRPAGIASMAGVLLSWALPVAGVLDAIENYALIHLLTGSRAEYWPVVAYWCAAPKFAIVFAGLAYVLLSYPATLLFRRS